MSKARTKDHGVGSWLWLGHRGGFAPGVKPSPSGGDLS